MNFSETDLGQKADMLLFVTYLFHELHFLKWSKSATRRTTADWMWCRLEVRALLRQILVLMQRPFENQEKLRPLLASLCTHLRAPGLHSAEPSLQAKHRETCLKDFWQEVFSITAPPPQGPGWWDNYKKSRVFKVIKMVFWFCFFWSQGGFCLVLWRELTWFQVLFGGT